MKIKTITLENFRCFRTAEIDLSADIVVIYGRNGVGKTAIFDAIEMGFIGNLGRHRDDTQAPNYLDNIYANKGARVKIDFDGQPQHWIEVKRASGNENFKFTSSGSWKSHKDFLYGYLVNEEYEPPRKETGPISELIRASILLSQENIRDFISGSSEDRSRIIANMAGSAYIQRCAEKILAVKKILAQKQKIEEEQKKLLLPIIGERDKKIEEYELRIQKYLQESNDVFIPWQSIVQKMERAEIFLQVTEPQTSDALEPITNAIRKLCEEKYDALSEKSKLLVEVQSLNRQQKQRFLRLKITEALALEGKKTLERSILSEKEILETLEEMNNQAAENQKLNLASLAGIDQLQKIRSLKLDLDKTKNLLINEQQELGKVREKERNISAFLNGKQEAVDFLMVEQNRLRPSIETEKANRKKIQNLIGSLPQYRIAKKRENELRQALVETDKLLVELTRKVNEKKDCIAKLERDKQNAYYEYNKSQENVSESKTMIAKMIRFAIESHCPLCGHDHESNASLLNAINEQMDSAVAPAVKEVLVHYEKLKSDIVIMNDECEKIENASKEGSVKKTAIMQEINEKRELINCFDVDMEALGIKPEIDSDLELTFNDLKAKSDLRIVDREVSLKKSEDKLQEEEMYLNNAREQLGQMLVVLQSKNNKLQEYETAFAQLKQALTEAVEIANIPDERISERLIFLRKTVEDTETKGANLSSLITKNEEALQQIKIVRQRTQNEIDEGEKKLRIEKVEEEDFYQKCIRLGFKKEVTEEAIELGRESLVTMQERITDLLDSLELYRANELKKHLLMEIDSFRKEKSIDDEELRVLNNRLDRISAATSSTDVWFNKLSGAIEDSVGRKIETFLPDIKHYFRAMIPFPYMFRDIVMSQGKNGVLLDLIYRGSQKECGEPKYFLSSAQANVLALATFLTLASKQTWSKLNTIMLDDPVQHLDDLDAVAFLDALRSISMGKFGKKTQIIISTCNLNLYLLMLKKFSLIKKSDMRFTGISITSNGLNPSIQYDIKAAT